MRVWMCLRQGALPCLRHIHTRILKTSKRLSPFKRLNAPFYSCSHADSPTDVRSPRVDKTTVLPPTPTQSGLRRAPPATIQCGPRQIQANFNLVIVLPESDSLVTQVDIGGGVWANGQVGHRPEPQRDKSSLHFAKGSFGREPAIFQPPRLSGPPSPHRILSINYFSSFQDWSRGGIFKNHGF